MGLAQPAAAAETSNIWYKGAHSKTYTLALQKVHESQTIEKLNKTAKSFLDIKKKYIFCNKHYWIRNIH